MSAPETEMALPPGFLYLENFLDEEEEAELVETFLTLSFGSFEYKGFVAKRRVIGYGWTYDFNTNELAKGKDIPAFLLPLRERAAQVAKVAPEELEEALLTEYTPGSQINWHRDLPMFDKVIGISLLGSCTMKLRSYRRGEKIVSVPLKPRSLYLMTGAARWNWQHHIPPVKDLRYSITFRTLKKKSRGGVRDDLGTADLPVSGQEGGDCSCNLFHKKVVERLRSVGRPVVVRIAEHDGVVEHDRRIALFPKGGMVAETELGQEVSLQRCGVAGYLEGRDAAGGGSKETVEEFL